MARITTTELIDHELRAHGTSLEDWASQRGLTPLSLVWMIEGWDRPRPEILLELHELTGIGVSLFGVVLAPATDS